MLKVSCPRPQRKRGAVVDVFNGPLDLGEYGLSINLFGEAQVGCEECPSSGTHNYAATAVVRLDITPAAGKSGVTRVTRR